MTSVRGRAAVSQYLASAPAQLKTLLRGAARAGATVVADEVKARSNSPDIAAAVKITTKAEDTKAVATIHLKGAWANALGTWQEYGTDPHYISVDDSQREGKTARRVNELERAGSLVINGQPVGKTVHHPGAKAEPFMRVSLDLKEGEAIKAAQAHINSRISKGKILPGGSEGDGA